MTEQRTTALLRANLRRQMDWTGRGLHLWRHEALALLADADALAGALAEVRRLRAALAWYADERNYRRLYWPTYQELAASPVFIAPPKDGYVQDDRGAKARAALAPQSGAPTEKGPSGE